MFLNAENVRWCFQVHEFFRSFEVGPKKVDVELLAVRLAAQIMDLRQALGITIVVFHLQKGTSYTPVLQGDLVSLTGAVVPEDCCYFDPAVVVDTTQRLEIVVDRRSKKSFLYDGVVEFHDPAGSVAGTLGISVAL